MVTKIRHIGFGVQGCIDLLDSVDGDRRDLDWAKNRVALEELKEQGIIFSSSCPEAVETSPGRWECPGHIKE